MGEEVVMEEEGEEVVDMVEEEEEGQLQWGRRYMSLHVKATISHYTHSSLTTPSPPHTSSLTGTRREAPVADVCDPSPDSVSS